MKIILFLAALLVSLTVQALDVRISWTASPADQMYWSAGEGVPGVGAYTVYSSTSVTGPFSAIAQTTNTFHAVTNATPVQAFYFVTISNYWGESLPSTKVNTPSPGGLVGPTRIGVLTNSQPVVAMTLKVTNSIVVLTNSATRLIKPATNVPTRMSAPPAPAPAPASFGPPPLPIPPSSKLSTFRPDQVKEVVVSGITQDRCHDTLI